MSKSTINVPVSTIRETADSITRCSDGNKDVLDRIQNLITAAESRKAWTGKSMKATKSAMENGQKKYQELIDELDQLAAFLQKYANDMETADTDTANAVKNIV